MKERDIVAKLLKTWRNEGWIKIPDSWGGKGQRFTPKKDVDLVKVSDRCEVKIVKAKTAKGLVFRPYKALRPDQVEILEKHDGLVAVGFVAKDWRGDNDGLVAIATARWSTLRQHTRLTLAGWPEWGSGHITKGQAWEVME